MEGRVQYRDVDKLDPKSVPNQVICQDCGPLETRIRPFLPVWIGNKETHNRDGLNLVPRLGHRPLDRFLFPIGQD